MNRNRRKPKGKQINPTFFIFCEGETEEKYIKFLKSKYRLPIFIYAKIAGNSITEKKIISYKKEKETHPKDKTYLVYDLDVSEMLLKLQAIKNTVLLSSNPCFELWYLLHHQEQKSFISSKDCLNKLQDHHKTYKKGVFDLKLKDKLNEKQEKAINRASKLEIHKNPSTQVFLLINELEEVLKSKNI